MQKLVAESNPFWKFYLCPPKKNSIAIRIKHVEILIVESYIAAKLNFTEH